MENLPKTNPSVFDEPFYQLETGPQITDREELDQVVWDEPAIQSSRPIPADATSYAKWYQFKKDVTPAHKRWFWWVLISLLGGPLAIVTALVFGNPTSTGGYLSLIVIAPIVEELIKMVLPLILLETKPYLFSSSFQIISSCMFSALFFASIENIMYLNVYIPDPTEFLATWRWQVCTAMHVGTSTLASLGLVRAWSYADKNLTRPPIHIGFPMFAAAMVIHGVYNTLAIFLDYIRIFD